MKTKSPPAKFNYKSYKIRLVSIIRGAKKKCYSDKLTESKGDMKRTWNILKKIMNKNNSKTILN